MIVKSDEGETVRLPDDLVAAILALSEKLGESPENLIIAAVDHFTRIPDEQRKAVVVGTTRRRRG